MPINLSLDAHLFIHDGDIFTPDDECNANLPTITKFFSPSGSTTIEFSQCCDEVGITVSLTVSLTSNRSAIQITGKARMYESISCPNNDLHDEKDINHIIPLDGNSQLIVQTSDFDDNSSTITLNFSAQNRPPLLLNNNLHINEGQIVTLSSTNLSAYNGQNLPDDGLRFIIRNIQHARFERSTNPGVAITSFTQGEINQGNIWVAHDGGEEALSYDVAVSDSDGFFTTVLDNANITFTNVEDGPTPILSNSEPSFIKGSNGVNVDCNMRLIDPDTDNATVTEASMTIDNCQPEQDVLVFNDQSNINGQYNPQNCRLELQGTAPIKDYETALTTIKYNNTDINNINPITRQIAIQAKGNDSIFGPIVTKNVGIHTNKSSGLDNAVIGAISGGSALLLGTLGMFAWRRRCKGRRQAENNNNVKTPRPQPHRQSNTNAMQDEDKNAQSRKIGEEAHIEMFQPADHNHMQTKPELEEGANPYFTRV